MRKKWLAIVLGLAILLTTVQSIPRAITWKEAATQTVDDIEPAAEITAAPTAAPTAVPTAVPTAAPTAVPTAVPTAAPTPTAEPTKAPTAEPTAVPTAVPAAVPAEEPAVVLNEDAPADPTAEPTAVTTEAPTAEPTAVTTEAPEEPPSVEPTVDPTAEPVQESTAAPEAAPTAEPTEMPTGEPVVEQTPEPTVEPLKAVMTTGQRYAFVGRHAVSVSLKVSGGVPTYQISYQLRHDGRVCTTGEASMAEAGVNAFSAMPESADTYEVIANVVDANGATVSAKISLPVAAPDNRNRTKWEKKLKEIELGDDWRENLIAVAETQIGYRESATDFIIDEDGKQQGYTLYGDWYHATYSEWCAMFVSWCLEKAGVPERDFPYEAGCADWMKLLKKLDAYETADSGYLPKRGDLVFFNHDREDDPDHVGIVEEVTEKKLFTIEGNSGKRVAREEYRLDDEQIMGYVNTEALMIRAGVLPEPKTVPTAEPEIQPTEAPETTEEPVIEATEEPETTEEPVTEVTEAPETTEEPVIEATEEPAVDSTEVPAVETTAEPVEESEIAEKSAKSNTAKIGYTDAKSVYLRAEPDTDSERMGRIRGKGTAVIVLDTLEADGDVWYRVRYGAQTAYIHGSLLNVSEETAEVPSMQELGVRIGYTNAEGVNLREKPTSGSDRVTGFDEAGIELVILDEVEKKGRIWYKVQFGDEEAYVSAGLVDLKEAEPEATAEPTAEPTLEPTTEPTVAPTAEPTATPEPVYYCGLDEHVHGEACLDGEGALICEQPEHTHDEACAVEPTVAPTAEPAATPVPVYYCGLDEHVHGEACVDGEGTLVCELPEHTHDEACAVEPTAAPTAEPTATPEPVHYCGLGEHVHGEACVDGEGALVCEQPEHTHDEACAVEPTVTPTEEPTATPEPVYYCGLDEHVHGEACVDGEGALICEQPEHTHDEACAVEPEITYYCNLEEHAHGADCYDAEGNVICTIPVHTHGGECLIQPTAVPEVVYYCGLEAHVHEESCFDENGALVCEIEEHVHDENCTVQPEADYVCGYEEHAHDELCLNADGILCCGMPAHQHGENCFDAQTVPEYLCGMEVHVHGAECFNEHNILICSVPMHEHSDACLAAEEVITYYCGLEEHIHTEECFDENAELICTAEEHLHNESCLTAPVYYCGLEEHVHAEGCYDESGALICELEEHEHSAACRVPVYYCGLEEHIHVESCYDENGEVICGFVEHIHGEGCLAPAFVLELVSDGLTVPSGDVFAPVSVTAKVTGGAAPYALNLQVFAEDETQIHSGSAALAEDGEHTFEFIPTALGVYRIAAEVVDIESKNTTAELMVAVSMADAETPEQWEATFADVELTGDPRIDIIAIARTQLGYEESEINFIVGEDGKRQGYTRYGAWYGRPYDEWCAMFASFCLHYAQVDGVPQGGNCASWIESLSADGLYRAAGSYCPMSGDLVFFDWDGDGLADHVGLVEECEINEESGVATVSTIEGNRGKEVDRFHYTLPEATILGYGQVGENPMQERIDFVVGLIDALPFYEEVEAALAELEADEEAYAAYLKRLGVKVLTAYAAYEALELPYQQFVSNQEKLMNLTWVLTSTLNTLPTDTVTVYQVDTYSEAQNTILYAKEATELASDGFMYWTAYVIKRNPDTKLLYVSNVVEVGTSKAGLTPLADDGFVLLVYPNPLNDVQVGDNVYCTVDYKTAKWYSENGYGKLMFYRYENHDAALQTVSSADTDELIQVNLYDYDDTINSKYNSNKTWPGFQQDNGTAVENLYSLGTSSFNFGNNITTDLAAGIESLVNNSGNGSINKLHASGANTAITGAVKSELGSDGYPALADTGASLGYLFTDGGSVDKKNSKSINGLFRYNETSGAYTFNSRENHAQFNSGSDTFTLYDQMISSNYIMYPFGNFLPFNSINSQATQASKINRDYFIAIADRASARSGAEYQGLAASLTKFIELMDAKYGTTAWGGAEALKEYFAVAKIPSDLALTKLDEVYSIDYDNVTNFFFGMEMKMNFIQPKGGMTGKDTNGDGNSDYRMVFEFTGDDDVWVFIDGKLFLDLSGIHRHVAGKIDFVNGTVTYYDLDPELGEADANARTVSFASILGSSADLNENGTFKDYTSHSFNFYYMERGAGSGVCRMNFNFPLLKQNSISVSKEVETDAEIFGEPEYQFQILKANSDGTRTDDLFIAAGTTYKVYDANGNQTGSGTVDEHGVFTLKGGQRAEFSGIDENRGKYYVRELLEGTVLEQYGNITVSGTSTTTSGDITVGNETFTGFDSPVKDMSDGATAFRFVNDVNEEKLGKLSVTKVLTDVAGETVVESEPFDFTVTLDGAMLPAGTEYTVGEETRTVETEGVISIRAGETATIGNILAGTKFTVNEAESAAYTVTYTPGNEGTVVAASEVKVEALNVEKGTFIEIPVTKTLLNEDGSEHTYEIVLQQVTDVETLTPVEGDAMVWNPVFTAAGSLENIFRIDYTTEIFAEAEEQRKEYYYLVSETAVEDDAMTLFDVRQYLVTVTVAMDEAAQAMTAEMSFVQIQPEPDSEEEITAIEFRNSLKNRKLTLTKEINGPDDGSLFQFTIQLEAEGMNETCMGRLAVNDMLTDVEVVFVDGQAAVSVELGHGDSFVIEGLPEGAAWTVTETPIYGFAISHKIGEGEETASDVAQGALNGEDALVAFINMKKYELPKTGGTGISLYTAGGVILAIALLMYNKNGKGRRHGEPIR